MRDCSIIGQCQLLMMVLIGVRVVSVLLLFCFLFSFAEFRKRENYNKLDIREIHVVHLASVHIREVGAANLGYYKK